MARESLTLNELLDRVEAREEAAGRKVFEAVLGCAEKFGYSLDCYQTIARAGEPPAGTGHEKLGCSLLWKDRALFDLHSNGPNNAVNGIRLAESGTVRAHPVLGELWSKAALDPEREKRRKEPLKQTTIPLRPGDEAALHAAIFMLGAAAACSPA